MGVHQWLDGLTGLLKEPNPVSRLLGGMHSTMTGGEPGMRPRLLDSRRHRGAIFPEIHLRSMTVLPQRLETVLGGRRQTRNVR